MATLSSFEFDVCLLSALNLSLPTDQGRLRKILATAADAKKPSQTLCKPAAADFSPQHGLGAPRGRSLPDGFTPPPGLSPPHGVACPDRPKGGECLEKGGSVTGDSIASYAEDTSVGAGSMTRFSSADFEAEEFEMNAEVSCFVPMPRFLKTTACKVPSPHEATGTTLPPVLLGADQVQKGRQCCPKEAPNEQQVLKQINEQQQQKQQRLQ